MKKSKAAKSSAEFDRRFDDGEDIHDLIDMSQATVLKQGKKVHITLDVAESLVKEIDRKFFKKSAIDANQKKGSAPFSMLKAETAKQ
jgi:hypothetical protein